MKLVKPLPRWRTAAALLIAYAPVSGSMRAALYRSLFGYEIGPGSRIALGTVILCSKFKTGRGAFIGRENRFTGPFSVELGEGIIIGRFNRFVAGGVAADKAEMDYALEFIAGDRVLIYESHLFDVYGRIEIGAGTWIAGAASQFWTHGASVMDRDIKIGADCYLGSAVRFAPGSAIGDRCVVGLGSVVVSRLKDDNAVLSGHPARKLRDIDPKDPRKFVFEAE